MPLGSQIALPERYRVTRHIANGGMASVWQAEDLMLGRIVAVKVLGAQFAADANARVRFQREARTAAQVSDHPHIVTIYDIGEHSDQAFLVMEHFAGGTVAERLRAARDGVEPVDRATALRWLREAAAGLDAAHAAGIVHRDVKPHNLLLDERDRLAVGDFGIARLADDTQLTQTGLVLGTAAYLSPEQANGEPVTAASDRYALAVVAYEMLAGRRPFASAPPSAQVAQRLGDDAPPASQAAPDLPAEIDAVLARGMAREPADRPATAAALVAGIEEALGPIHPPEAPPVPTQSAREAAPPAPPPPSPAVPAPSLPPAPQARRPEAEPAPPPARDEPPPSRKPRAAGAFALQRRRLGTAGALGALLVGGIAALAIGGGGRDPESKATGSRTSTTPKAPAPAGSGEQASDTASPSPSDLNDRGFRRLNQGRHAEAVESLRASVDGYRKAGRTSEIGYAYALFNLAVALKRSGDPAAAIPLLQERLRFADQRPRVIAGAHRRPGTAGRRQRPARSGQGQEGQGPGR